MHLDQNPFFRKAITPWYDTNFSCWVLVGVMSLVFIFAVVGIFVASSVSDFSCHIWFPGFLAFLSFFLVVKIVARVRHRAKTN
ncbi:MAG: hypothetical protein KKE62_18215 [Proteobacteria bacterium]|nr:hypothetical protein [Pseudomonadota bacterium]MBU1386828.1 hypothetical protein [Pseudomonadota bacterium]MBU1544772.1 hypothetical protein [Pseudomonadota bacterium]MBU2429774.1 hypothetical protein [Pseudomonadota bacterium]MBU2481556.1 hypothetical protein [Pseudomonadota bacterium]